MLEAAALQAVIKRIRAWGPFYIQPSCYRSWSKIHTTENIDLHSKGSVGMFSHKPKVKKTLAIFFDFPSSSQISGGTKTLRGAVHQCMAICPYTKSGLTHLQKFPCHTFCCLTRSQMVMLWVLISDCLRKILHVIPGETKCSRPLHGKWHLSRLFDKNW